MDFKTFWAKLKALEEGVSINYGSSEEPPTMLVKKAYWGAPPKGLPDLPCVINAMAEPDRVLGFGSRDQRMRINVQMFVARATVEDEVSSVLATAFWFAAKDAFDKDHTIGGTVSMATLRGLDPTVPVILGHGGQAYFGFNAILEIQAFEGFDFSGGE